MALKQPLVRYKGEWVALDPDQLDAMVEFFNQTEAEQNVNLLDALKIQSSDTSPTGIEIEKTEVVGWLADMFNQFQNPDGAVVPTIPDDLDATLRPYQERGYGWLAQMRQMGLGACLADDMGLGKTLPKRLHSGCMNATICRSHNQLC